MYGTRTHKLNTLITVLKVLIHRLIATKKEFPPTTIFICIFHEDIDIVIHTDNFYDFPIL